MPLSNNEGRSPSSVTGMHEVVALSHPEVNRLGPNPQRFTCLHSGHEP